MSDEQDRLYNDVDSGLLELPDGTLLEMSTAFAMITRARQVASNPRTFGFDVDGSKLAQLETDLIEISTTGAKVVVFISYSDTGYVVKNLATRLGWNVACLFDTTKHNTENEKRRFQTDPACNLIIVNPQAGGLGVNLSMANYELFYEYGYDLELHDQALERAHRPGLVGPLTVIYYVTMNTVEESIIEALQSKKHVSSEILRDPMQLRNFLKYKTTFRSKTADPTLGIRF
jgi:SNF2 family DNA or RNA helicase